MLKLLGCFAAVLAASAQVDPQIKVTGDGKLVSIVDGEIFVSEHGWNASMETLGQGACRHLGVTCCNGWKHDSMKE